MTLVVLECSPELITCYADTRITARREERLALVTETYSKVFLLPVRVESFAAGKYTDTTYRFGVAFATSSVVFVQNCVGLFFNCFHNIFTLTRDAPPIGFDTLVSFAVSIVRQLFEDARSSPSPPVFNILLFGTCPQSKKARAVEVTLETVDGVFQVVQRPIDCSVKQIVAFGSGKAAFEREMLVDRPLFWGLHPVAEAAYETVRRQGDAATGGGLSIAFTSGDLARMFPVSMPLTDSPDETQFVVAISGLVTQGPMEFPTVAPSLLSDGVYAVGRYTHSAGLHYVETNALLRSIGIQPSKKTTVPTRNYAFVQRFLDDPGRQDSALDLQGRRCQITSLLEVLAMAGAKTRGPTPQDQTYGVACPHCKKYTAIFYYRGPKRTRPRFINGAFGTKCENCGHSFIAPAEALV